MTSVPTSLGKRHQVLFIVKALNSSSFAWCQFESLRVSQIEDGTLFNMSDHVRLDEHAYDVLDAHSYDMKKH